MAGRYGDSFWAVLVSLTPFRPPSSSDASSPTSILGLCQKVPSVARAGSGKAPEWVLWRFRGRRKGKESEPHYTLRGALRERAEFKLDFNISYLYNCGSRPLLGPSLGRCDFSLIVEGTRKGKRKGGRRSVCSVSAAIQKPSCHVERNMRMSAGNHRSSELQTQLAILACKLV